MPKPKKKSGRPYEPKKRNRAAQDATLINTRSLRKRVANLEGRVDIIERAVRGQGMTLPTPPGLPPEG